MKSQTLAKNNTQQSLINEITTLIKPEMDTVNQLIKEQLHSNVNLINEISVHIIHSGGKRIRPLIHLLTAAGLSYKGNNHIAIAVIIEFIHTATLLHDDVIDESNLRRGKETANSLWGNAASVLTGDFLYSRAFQLMVSLNDIRIQQVMADTTNRIAEGEILQLLHQHNPATTQQNYFKIIQAKTAELFAAATQLSGVINNVSPKIESDLINFGMKLGMAFQITDDILDYTATVKTMGKNIGDDLAEGKPTLPLIYALENCNSNQKSQLKQIIIDGASDQLETVLTIINDTNAIDYCYQQAKKIVYEAKEHLLLALPQSPFLDALIQLTDYTINRLE